MHTRAYLDEINRREKDSFAVLSCGAVNVRRFPNSSTQSVDRVPPLPGCGDNGPTTRIRRVSSLSSIPSTRTPTRYTSRAAAIPQ